MGKSSLCNSLFESAIARVEGVDFDFARKPHEIFVNLKNEIDVIIVDFPGVDCDSDADFCRSAIQDLDLVLWLIHSRDRDCALGLDFYSAIIKSGASIPVILVITKIDELCDFHESKLSLNHMGRIALQENDVSRKFSLPVGNIISVSVKADLYNIDSLESMIVNALSA